MPLSGQTAPREQLARSQSIPPRRRRYLPPPIVALAHDPALLFQRPTTPGTSLDHLKSRHLRHSRMISHTPMSSPPHPSHKAVLSAGIRYRCLSLMRAFLVVNCQSALVWLALRSCSQAAISSMRICLLGMRRSRHWDVRTPSSDSARLSQLPCFGV